MSGDLECLATRLQNARGRRGPPPQPQHTTLGPRNQCGMSSLSFRGQRQQMRRNILDIDPAALLGRLDEQLDLEHDAVTAKLAGTNVSRTPNGFLSIVKTVVQRRVKAVSSPDDLPSRLWRLWSRRLHRLPSPISAELRRASAFT
jgi:hypothetical protein